MRILSVGSNNDIGTTRGRFNISTDLQAVLQACEHAVKAIVGEMIYAADRGLNSFTSAWDGSPNILSFESSARAAITRVEHVVAIEAFDVSIVNDSMAYSATIRTTFGTGVTNGNI